jgi:hypothetical protein
MLRTRKIMTKSSVLIFSLATLLLPGFSLADTIILKDGVRGTGVIAKVTPDTLYFVKTGSTHMVAIPRVLVERFEMGEGIRESVKSGLLSSDSVKSTREPRDTIFETELTANDGVEIQACRRPDMPDSCTAFTLLYKGGNFEIGERPTVSLIRNTDFRENPYMNGIGFRIGAYMSAGWGTFLTILGGILNANNVEDAKIMEYAGIGLLGNATLFFRIGYARKSKYMAWEQRHPFRQPVTEDKDE